MAQQLNFLHECAASYTNRKRAEKPVYKEGDLVLFLRPHELSSNLQSEWIGPCKVLKRVGKGSYTILTKPNVEHHAHNDQLKIHHEDIYSGSSTNLNFYRGSSKDINWQTDEYEAENIST